MTIILQRLRLEDFDPDHIRKHDDDEGFKVFSLIDNNKNTTFEDIKHLEANDKKAARLSIIKLLKYATTGQLFSNMFDEKQFHTGYEFDYSNKRIVIHRLRLTSVIRIYIYFLSNQTVVVLKISAKRKNSISNSEKAYLEHMSKMVIDCSNANLVSFVEDCL